LKEFVAAGMPQVTEVSPQASLEEAFFLGLRLNRGIDLEELCSEFGEGSVSAYSAVISEFTGMGLLERAGSVIRLTPSGRLLSNEVFEQFVSVPDQVA
jgi:oxygen-independent coproporphyrinogen-3 oxidase